MMDGWWGWLVALLNDGAPLSLRRGAARSALAAVASAPGPAPAVNADTRLLALLQAPPAMARSAATPLLVALLALMLAAGSNAQGPGITPGIIPPWFSIPPGFTVPPGAEVCAADCTRSCNIPVNRAPSRATLQFYVSLEGGCP